MILATFCGGNATGSKNATGSEADKLWTMLNGYWKYVVTTVSDLDDPQLIFCYLGYNDENKPISNIVWGYEGGEAEYVTEVTILDEHRYRVTFEVPANKEEGLFEVHDAYTLVRDYDLSDYSNKKLTIESSGNISEWKYIGTTFPENIFDD